MYWKADLSGHKCFELFTSTSIFQAKENQCTISIALPPANLFHCLLTMQWPNTHCGKPDCGLKKMLCNFTKTHLNSVSRKTCDMPDTFDLIAGCLFKSKTSAKLKAHHQSKLVYSIHLSSRSTPRPGELIKMNIRTLLIIEHIATEIHPSCMSHL